MVLADILVLYCSYFKIERPDIMSRIKELVDRIGAEPTL